ncbi:M20 family metallo-hydrolase [Celerinatantimonas diazotrophica]|uniref:Aminobenzoyl-glutamate utilization protein A n=1 Tax=Celerinatantimonas diazotrophica TaxID=412034 RepID=A0A4R1J8R6_9GAMM|nr:M20 family metallo-hydrolase [Celerinatantimonas diazotrophica]TCK46734.1 aminobenzoyl-glutamate utilization protein A [Celerinatantimonas diazotrophica]CAG9295436.1 p-aminobenzoyl-glutamate hydrolase subunit A [Celerinatantimonas diazotrophica]
MSVTEQESQLNTLTQKMVEWRRDLHKHPESGWVEFRTATLVADKLDKLGYELAVGRDVICAESRMGVPEEEFLEAQKERALQQGALAKWIDAFDGGFTGIVATLDTGIPGPTVGLRVDMDALDLEESSDCQHVPEQCGFSSINHNMAHACGHDGHTAIGLGVAHYLMENKAQLCGKIKLIFQPAEEGTRGAKSMADAGVVDDVDLFIAIHIGTGVPDGEVICGSDNFLATTKFDVNFHGVPAHAGGNPEKGHNAILAAAQATIGLYSISRHCDGASRINVGVLNGGTGRNVIAQHAHLKVECRGENNDINDYMFARSQAIIQGVAQMYEVEYDIEVVGAAQRSIPSPEWVTFIAQKANELQSFSKVHHGRKGAAGSEDATYFMERVKQHGGQATYMIFGTELAAGHHNDKFDFNESVLQNALILLSKVVIEAKEFA